MKLNLYSHMMSLVLAVIASFSLWFGFICPSTLLEEGKEVYTFLVVFAFLGIFCINIQYPLVSIFFKTYGRIWFLVNSLITFIFSGGLIYFVSYFPGIFKTFFEYHLTTFLIVGCFSSFLVLPLTFIWQLGNKKHKLNTWPVA